MTRDNKIIMFSLFLWGIGESMWYFISGIYLEDLGATPEQVGLALGFAALTVALSFLAGGLLADRFDRKYLMLAGWALGAVAPPLMALAGDWQQFMIGYTVFNLSSYVVPVIDTYVSHSAGSAPLERIFPIVYAGFWLGSVLGPQVSKALLGTFDLRALLLSSSALFGFSTLAVAFVKRQPVTRSTSRVEPRTPLIDALRPALWFFAFLFLIDFAMSIGAQFIPLYLERIDWRVADVSGAISAQMIGTAILSVLIGHVSAGKRRRGLLIAQLLVFTSMAAFAFGARTWGGLAVAGYFLLGGFQSARQQAVAQVAGYVGTQHRGTAFAVASTVSETALAAARASAGLLFAADPARPFFAGLLLIPIGVLLTLRLRGPHAAVVPETARLGPVDMMR